MQYKGTTQKGQQEAISIVMKNFVQMNFENYTLTQTQMAIISQSKKDKIDKQSCP